MAVTPSLHSRASSECSEGSGSPDAEILRCAQDDSQLFSLVAKKSMKQQKRRLQSRWATVNGQRVHARVSAVEPVTDKTEAIVMVHGLVVSSRYMLPTAV